MNTNNDNTGIAIDATHATVAGAVAAETPVPSGHPRMTMLAAKIATTFLSRRSDPLLVNTTARCIDGLTGNPYFPQTQPALADVIATRDAYVQAVNGLDRSPTSIARRNEARISLVQGMRELALFLQQKSQGDRVKLLSTGFPLQKSRRPSVGLPTVPGGVRMRRGRVATQLIAYCDRVDSARAYQWRYAIATAPTVWTMPDPGSSTRFLIDGVVPGTVYLVQVRAFSTRGAGDWSDTAMLMAA
jgi:hypothetical protein